MDADLDTLLPAVYCTADDLRPEKPGNARRRVTDAEVVTLCVAQAIMGIPSDRRLLAVADKRLRGLFPEPQQPSFHKRRRRLRDAIEWLVGVFANDSPGARDDVVLLDSTPVECGRSRETARSASSSSGSTSSRASSQRRRPSTSGGSSSSAVARVHRAVAASTALPVSSRFHRATR
jgi:hypothetical protein